jgi:hypothetical protein
LAVCNRRAAAVECVVVMGHGDPSSRTWQTLRLIILKACMNLHRSHIGTSHHRAVSRQKAADFGPDARTPPLSFHIPSEGSSEECWVVSEQIKL